MAKMKRSSNFGTQSRKHIQFYQQYKARLEEHVVKFPFPKPLKGIESIFGSRAELFEAGLR